VPQVDPSPMRPAFWPSVKRNWRELGLLGLASLVLIVLTIFSFFLANRADRDRRAAAELSRFTAGLTEFMRTLRSMESSQRGYALTSDPDFLEPYNRLRPKAAPLFNSIRASVPEAASANSVLGLLSPLVESKLAEMATTVSLVQTGRQDEAIRTISEGYGQRLMDQIEKGIETVQMREQNRLWSNEQATARLERIRVHVDAVGALLVITFATLSLFLVMRSNHALQSAQDALERINDDLEDTVQERTAALKRANEEVQRFAYIVSHDLRSPLVNIMGFTAELEELRSNLFAKLQEANSTEGLEPLAQEFDEAFGFIKSSIARMDRLIGAILKISREGSRALNPEPIEMGPMLETIVSAFAHQIREKEAEIIVEKLPNIVSDRLAIEQIFSNLIDNAIKFLKPGAGGKVIVSGEERGLQVTFKVADNGRGIEAKDHQRIFELFRRSGPQTAPGEGMGLAYVVALLRRLNGMIEVKSEPDRGSTFIISMPKALARPERKAA
jgi:signal transduction histidine kinase